SSRASKRIDPAIPAQYSITFRSELRVAGCHLIAPRRRNRCVLIIRSAARQAHGEHRALARLAPNRHVATHHAREPAGDGKPEPRAAEALRGRGISLTELLEQPCLLLGGHADAGTASSIQSRPSATLRARSVTLPCFVNLHALLRSEQDLSQPHG